MRPANTQEEHHMNEEQKLARMAMELLTRAPLKGAEVAAYCEVNNWLQAKIDAAPSPSPDQSPETAKAQ